MCVCLNSNLRWREVLVDINKERQTIRGGEERDKLDWLLRWSRLSACTLATLLGSNNVLFILFTGLPVTVLCEIADMISCCNNDS